MSKGVVARKPNLIKLSFLVVMIFLLMILIIPPSLGTQVEAWGTVTNIVDGDTFDLYVEGGDGRITSSVERIRLADVDAPEMDTQEGMASKDMTSAILLNKRVSLDIDDLSASGRDSYGRLICVVYLLGCYNQPIAMPCFNRMLVDSGKAKLYDFNNNEFDPHSWWASSPSRGPSSYASQGAGALPSDVSSLDSNGYSSNDGGSKPLPKDSSGSNDSGLDLERLVGNVLKNAYRDIMRDLNRRINQAV
jgi:endonuclease YncB( thermonuclease family)